MKEGDIKEFIRVACIPLCDYPDQIQVASKTDENGVFIMLYVNRNDMGRIIGKKGNIINSFRSILHAIGNKYNARYSLKVDDLKRFVKGGEESEE